MDISLNQSKSGSRARGSLLNNYTARLGDAVERHRANVALSSAKVEAELASRAKSVFITNMSHELRTPLNAILGFSEILEENGPGQLPEEKSREYYGLINKSAKRLLSAINEILELSQIQTGETALEAEPTNAEAIAHACIGLIAPRAAKGQVNLEYEVSPNTPAIIADGAKLKQALMNVLGNAVKFTEPGGSASFTVGPARPSGVSMIIRDTGIGMDEAEIETALQPFGQAESGLDRKYDGTGLGLPIARSLIELHGGTLDLTSSKGEGTTVTLIVPHRPPEIELRAPNPNRASRTPPRPETPSSDETKS